MHSVETMAFTGKTPWHGLGNRLSPHESIDAWKERAGMNWKIHDAAVQYSVEGDPTSTRTFPGQRVLYRSDTAMPLAVVSDRYKVVQPGELLEFYRDLTELGGFEMETAGVLRAGRKFWALARTGRSATLRGRDQVDGFLLLATACDGTLATTAQFTSVRVVCNNTLNVALADASQAIKIPHRTHFDAELVKRRLGIAVSSWDAFVTQMRSMSETQANKSTVNTFLASVFTPALGAASSPSAAAISATHSLYEGQGKGSQLASSANTVWGLLNSVTEYVDHHRRARSHDHRLDAAWFGLGAQIKARAWKGALALIS